MRVIPEDHPSKLPSKTLSGQASPEDPFGALSEEDTCSRSPAESPSKSPPKPPSGPSFGKCHLSRKPARKPSLRKPPLRKLLRNLLRSYLRKVPRVPECRAKNLPSRILSEPAACPRMPQAGRIPPEATRARHLSRVPKLKQPTLRKFSERATCPRVPKRTPHPGASECATCSACVFPRMTSGCAACPEPGDHPGTAQQPRESSPEDPPGHSANAPRVPAALLPHRIPEKSNKMFETSKIHRNSSFNQKNPKLIFSVSY